VGRYKNQKRTPEKDSGQEKSKRKVGLTKRYGTGGEGRRKSEFTTGEKPKGEKLCQDTSEASRKKFTLTEKKCTLAPGYGGRGKNPDNGRRKGKKKKATNAAH